MKGFTLLEVLVTVIIFSFIVLSMFGLSSYVKTNYDTNLVLLNLQREARQGMGWLSREIREAHWSSIFRSTDANGNAVIIFDTPNINDVGYSVVQSQVSNQTFWRLQRNSTTGTKIRANDITGLTINDITGVNAGSHILNITVTASKTLFSGGTERTLSFPLTEQVDVRN